MVTEPVTEFEVSLISFGQTLNLYELEDTPRFISIETVRDQTK